MVAEWQPGSTPPAAHPAGPTRVRAALVFAVSGDIRFLSHHDELHMLLRALVRARWPLAYSQGFNPKPHVIVPLPRNVGTAADQQLALVDLGAPRAPAELFESLAGQLPAGYTLACVIAPVPRVVPHAERVRYDLDVMADDAVGLNDRIERLLAQTTLVVQRDYGPGRASRPIDIRPCIEQVQLVGRRLRLGLRCSEQRTARPAEVITELGLAAQTYSDRLRRAHVQWNIELSGPNAGPAARERNTFDNQENHSEEAGRRS
jgi:radical SAM-linked protein